MNIIIPRTPRIQFNIPKVDVNIPKVEVNIPKVNILTGRKSNESGLQQMDKGYKIGYKDGYNLSTDESEDKDTVNNEFWLGYSCGYRDGRLDKENGNEATSMC